MVVTEAKIIETVKRALQSSTAAKLHGYAAEEAGGLLDHYPAEILCSVGVMLATEGVYRLILREQEGVYGQNECSGLSSNELQSTENVIKVSKEV